MVAGQLWNSPATQQQHGSCGRIPSPTHWPTPPWGPFPVLGESPCLSFLRVMCWIFPTCDTCRLSEVRVIYVWKWSRWRRHLILHWSHALNFNLCPATDLLFYLEQNTTALCTSAHPSVQTYLAMWPSLADPHLMGWLRVCINMRLDSRTILDENSNHVVAQNKHKAFLHWTVEITKYIQRIIYSTNAAMPTGTKIKIFGISVLAVCWIIGPQVLLGAGYRDEAIEPGSWVSRERVA